MAKKKNKNTFAKRQREMERMRKANEKRAKRQNKGNPSPGRSYAPPSSGSSRDPNAPTLSGPTTRSEDV